MAKHKVRLLRPSSRLIEHDIRLELKELSPGVDRVVATVECERRGCKLEVDTCGYCERFARIDVHEAGYTMLCRSADQGPDDTGSDGDEP